MKYFVRAVKMSLKYKWSLALAVFSSMMVALLWGANISAVYPFIEVVFDEKSLHQWVDDKIATQLEVQASLTAENEQLRELRRDRAQLLANNGTDEFSRSDDEFSKTADSSEFASLNDGQITDRIRKNNQEIEDAAASLPRYLGLEPIIKRYMPSTPFETLALLMVLLVAGTILKCIFLVLNNYLVARVSSRTVLDLQNHFFRKTLKMDLAEFGERGTGDLIGRIRGETRVIGNSVRTLFGKTVQEPFKMAVCLIGAAWLNWRLLLFSMLICPLAAYLMLRLTRSIKRANQKAMEESAKLMDRLFQAVTYIKVVKSNNMQAHERSRFSSTTGEVYSKGMKIALYNSFFRVNNEFLGVAIVSMSVLAGGYLVLNHTQHLFGIRLSSYDMGFADLLLFYALVVGISDPLRKLGDVYNSFQSGIVASERIFPLLDLQPNIKSAKNPISLIRQPSLLEFEDVSFSYSADNPVLNGVSFALQPGESMAIVGANGSGKSTMINLLPRFFDPDSGSIRINGHDINEYSIRDLRRHISLVTQQTMLFNETVMENIRYGVHGATEDMAREAAIKAHAHEFISNSLDNGYESMVGEHGGRLSGGQRQRLALARAILRNSPLLILDEATSQIDPESEQLIHQTLKELVKDRSVIMITHRASTLDLADKVMVMEEGRVADFGTHEELLARCEPYRRFRNVSYRESA